MKILIVIDSIGSGGAQRIAAYLAEGLVNKSYQTDIFLYEKQFDFFESDFKKIKIKIHTPKNFSKNKIFKGINIIKSLRSKVKSYDIIISFMHTPSIYSTISMFGIKRGKLITFELSSSIAPVSYLKRILFYLSCLYSDLVITNSITETNIMRKKPGLKHKVKTIWNGYEIESMKFNLIKNKRKINQLLIVGRIAYPKNGLNLLKGLKLFHDKNGWLPNVIWAGRKDYDKRSIKMQDEMKKFLENNDDVANKFKFIGEVKDINKAYHNSDALVHPSIYEGLPNVICEAMIFGCCVIASSVCDHPKILGNKRGILFDPKNPSSISKSIEKFNKMSLQERNKMATDARLYAEKNFSLSSMINSFEEIF